MQENVYSVVAITDGVKTWAKNYDNAIDAVNAYNSFRDHGFCTQEYVITLVEPNGKMHTKVFEYPESKAIHV